MAEDGASANGHRPARRRKHIYPPLEQMAAEQAASAERRIATDTGTRTAIADVAPEATPPPAPPVIELGAPAETNGQRPARKRKHIYPPPQRDATPASAMAVAEAAEAAEAAEPSESALATIDAEEGVDAESVELRLSAVGMVDAGDVQFSQGALGAARADSVTVDQGALGAALASNVEVSRGYARSIVARQVQLDRAAARIIVAADVKAERSAVMLLVARRVTGDVRVLLDWRGAVAFGAVAGLVMGILRGRRGAK